ncbi:YihY/virulence factor BrkB family protein [Streptomyces sp. SP2-10]|uniref:YihY/virulence factor BrkB family protein n=1 Tax=Streptomyces sp. SP2-10 TaxID=2873385 RepID=UPI001CA6506E|nr:YihY/virulence factor BrkB family protein [Streptomyces sp. SP2-10]MBY8841872.1 YihY/virulence factor BrkB family protein [Streptomyces sp. SP2-10]
MSGGKAPDQRRQTVLRHADQRWRSTVRRFEASGAGRLWDRLSSVDFFGHSFQLAALAFLCFFPFLIIITAAAGRHAAAVVVGWLGLNQQAAQAVASLFTPTTSSYTLTVTSAALLLFGVMAVAGTLQSWYRMLFDVTAGGWRNTAAQFAWLAWLFAYAITQSEFGRAFDSWFLLSLVGFLWAVLFWWGSMYVLLARAVPWRALFLPALVTSVCWTGLGVFSAYYFSAAIVANEQKYGPIGVVMAILSWLVAVGVVIHLGATVGRMVRVTNDRPSGAPGHRKPADGNRQ